jgi:tetratricopeptide (TPR) repeat protein
MVLVRPDDPELAVRLAREALASADLPPKTRVNCLYTVADVGLETDQIEAAGRALDELVETRRLAPDWTLVGRLRQRTGSRDALAAFEKAVQIAPFRPQIRRQLADAYRQAGDTAAARREQQITDQLQMKKEK